MTTKLDHTHTEFEIEIFEGEASLIGAHTVLNYIFKQKQKKKLR